jgi:hypothetical protein
MPNDMKCYFDSVKNTITSWGNSVVDGHECPEDFSFDKYVYIPNEDHTFNEDGIQLKAVPIVIDNSKRSINVDKMNSYMQSLVIAGELSQAAFDQFLSETNNNATSYAKGSSRLISWIDTVDAFEYYPSTSGFKTKEAYRGASSNGLEGKNGNYERANRILAILNDL